MDGVRWTDIGIDGYIGVIRSQIMLDWGSWRRWRWTVRAIKASNIGNSRLIQTYMVDVVIVRNYELDE